MTIANKKISKDVIKQSSISVTHTNNDEKAWKLVGELTNLSSPTLKLKFELEG